MGFWSNNSDQRKLPCSVGQNSGSWGAPKANEERTRSQRKSISRPKCRRSPSSTATSGGTTERCLEHSYICGRSAQRTAVRSFGGPDFWRFFCGLVMALAARGGLAERLGGMAAPSSLNARRPGPSNRNRSALISMANVSHRNSPNTRFEMRVLPSLVFGRFAVGRRK